mgnify:CR=1 FL=1
MNAFANAAGPTATGPTATTDAFDLSIDDELRLTARDVPRELLSVFRSLGFLTGRSPGAAAAEALPALSRQPGVVRLTGTLLPWSADELTRMSRRRLWQLHASWERGEPLVRDIPAVLAPEVASMLTLKRILAAKELRSCQLCAWRCKVDRLAGARGRCGLDHQARLARLFVNHGDEAEISPSLVVSPAGCSWRCPFCQYHRALRTDDGQAWVAADVARAIVRSRDIDESQGGVLVKTLQFMGGNPDESLPAILDTLEELGNVPNASTLPVVWNANGYATARTMRLLKGVVDVWLLDVKHGNEACARRLGAGPQAVSTGRYCLRLASGGTHESSPAGVIVRLLILPGHVHCCALPVLRWLARWTPGVLLNLMAGQYEPAWRARRRDGTPDPRWPELERRLSPDEKRTVVVEVRRLGLREVAAPASSASASEWLPAGTTGEESHGE